MTQADALSRIELAKSPKDLFSGDPHTDYKRLAKLVHPDKASTSIRDRAEKAFIKLGKLYAEILHPAMYKVGPWKLTESSKITGGICDVYYAEGFDKSAVVKIARSFDHESLLQNEKNTLLAIRQPLEDGRGQKMLNYLPEVLASFSVSGHRASVLSFASDCHTLEHLKTYFPNGIDFRHIVWMMNRVFEIIGWSVNRAGIIHGAILPNHLMYRPADHGLVLVDWTASVDLTTKGHIPYLVKRWEKHYPQEVRKKKAYVSTDLYMAAKAMQYAAGDIPKRFRPFFEWLLAESPAARPSDIYATHDRWKALAKEEYGMPVFVRLDVPVS